MRERWLRRNERALSLERAGHEEDAIDVYEANLLEGCDATLTFHRLAHLYRRLDDLDGEARVLARALELVGPTAGRYASLERRLELVNRMRRERATQRPARARRTADAPAGTASEQRPSDAAEHGTRWAEVTLVILLVLALVALAAGYLL